MLKLLEIALFMFMNIYKCKEIKHLEAFTELIFLPELNTVKLVQLLS